MKNFSKVSLGALFIVLMTSPAFAELASKTYVERKTSVNDDLSTDLLGRIAVYASDASGGQKIVGSPDFKATDIMLKQYDMTKVGLNAATAATGTFDFFAPLTSGTTGQILKAVTGGAPTWGTDLDHITTATTSGAGNAVTAITADANGALTVTKGQTFLTSADLPAAYILPAATSAVLGGVKLNSDTVQSVAANAVSTATGRTYGIQNNSAGQMVVNVPWVDVNNKAYNGASTAGTAAAYTLATTQPAFAAADLTAGSIVIATIHLANSASPTLSVGGQAAKPIFMIDTGAAATAGALKANTIYSFTFNGSNWYAKQIDTDTIYTGTAPINVSGTTISHNTSGVTSGTYGPGANATLTYGGTFGIPSFTVDANGHTTVAATRTMTMPALPADADTMDSVATGTTAGSANTYTLAGTGFVLTRGSHVVAKINAANTGAATLNVNSTGAKAIQFEGVALASGMLKANTDYTFVYDGTYWQLLSDNDTIYTHPTITRTDTTSSAALTAGGTVTIVDGVTTNAQGHLTAVNLKTATLPELSYAADTIAANVGILTNGSGTNGSMKTKTLTAGSNVTITGGSGTITIAATDTDTIYTGTAPINVSGTTISHNTSGVTSGTYGPGANATLTYGGTFGIPSFTVDANGHTTVAATRTMTMPADADTMDSVATGTTAGSANTYTLAGTGFVLTRGSHVVAKINAANTGAATLNVNSTGAKTIQFEGAALTAGMLKVNTDYTFVYDGTYWQLLSDNDTIYTHPTITRTDTTSSAALTAGGTVTIVDGVTTNAQGHLTAVNLKTATLPADQNTTNLSYAADTIAANVGILTNGSGTDGSMKTKTLTAGDNVTITGGSGTITIGHNTSGVTAAAYGPTANATLTSGGTFTVPSFTVDAKGHTTVAATRTMTMPTIPVDTNSRAFNGYDTAGTAAAYTLATTQPAFTAADLTDGSIVIATIHVTNSANPTLSVGGQTAKPIFMIGTGAAAAAGALKEKTIYSFTFNGSNWYAKDIDTNTAANLSTTSTTALSTSASESLLSGTVSLHKVAKTGTYSDLIGAPAITDIPTACTAANTTCSLNYGKCGIGENANAPLVACPSAQYYWEIVVR